MKKKQTGKETKRNRSKIRTNNRENKTRNATSSVHAHAVAWDQFWQKTSRPEKTRFLHRIQCPILGC